MFPLKGNKDARLGHCTRHPVKSKYFRDKVNTEDTDSKKYFPRIHFTFIFPSPPRN